MDHRRKLRVLQLFDLDTQLQCQGFLIFFTQSDHQM